MHYNQIFSVFGNQQWKVVYQPSCLTRPYTHLYWNIKYPDVQWNDDTIVVLHCQDFLSIHGDRCPELENITQHYGDRSRQVIVVHWNYDLGRVYSGPLNLIYFPTHTYEILCNLRSQNFQDWRNHSLLDRRNYVWQCLNGIPRAHRRCTHQWLKSIGNGITCLGKIDPLPRDAYADVYVWHGDPLINEKNLVRLSWIYDHAWINIVTETQYTESPGIISEKTIFALISGQIPIIIGYQGVVEDCRRLGFDMFDDIVDHSYDNMKDDYRWQGALELNQHLLESPSDLSHLLPRLQSQRDWCLDQWPEMMISNYRQRCVEIQDCLANA